MHLLSPPKIGPIGPIKRIPALLVLLLLFPLSFPGWASQGEGRIILDADSGRVLRLDNPEIAVESSFPPGSLLKVFAVLYGLRENIISPARTIHCKGAIILDGRRFECWEPAGHGRVNLYKALAYSCNVYFYHYGLEVDGAGFMEFLRGFGFGESPGKMPQRLDRLETVKLFAGLTRQLEITPLQAAKAFAAVVNGGKRVLPHGGDLNISQFLPYIRRGLTEGSTYGTCAGYNEAVGGFAKTGTAPWVNGFRTHGWFAGYVPINTAKGLRRFVVLVFKQDGTGAKDALPAGLELAKSFIRRASDKGVVTVSLFSLLKPKRLEIQGRLTRLIVQAGDHRWQCRNISIALSGRNRVVLTMDGGEQVETGGVSIRRAGEQGIMLLRAGSIKPRAYPGSIRVRGNGDYLEILNRLFMAPYLRGVIGNEMGYSRQALKAQAVVSRTYALKNLDRHGDFNFCDTTHCQHYTGELKISLEVTAAVAETVGEVLIFKGQLCDVFYFSTCGGRTGGYEGVWNDKAVPYLSSIDDGDRCKGSPHFRWTFMVKPQRLFNAMARYDGCRPMDIEITTIATGGWVKSLSLLFEDGSRKKMRGEEFHIQMGREFGWSKIKSANFVIERSKDQWLFKGRGLGHGVGLCQWGAYRLSLDGKTYRRILLTYFPGTTIGLY